MSYCDVAGASWHVKWSLTRLFFLIVCCIELQRNINALFLLIQQWLVGSQRDGQVKNKLIQPKDIQRAILVITVPVWWRHHMETLFPLLALCEGNPPITGGFPSKRATNMGLDVIFEVSQSKQFNKHLSCRCYETPWCSLWRHDNVSENLAVLSHPRVRS